MAASHHKPVGYQSVVPYFTVQDAAQMIRFLTQVFNAEELNRHSNEDGSITHAELRLGETIVEVSDGNDKYPPRSNSLHVFVEDTDDCYRRALDAGAVSLYEPADMPYGERSGGIEDPFGNHWYIATFTKGKDRGYY
ncbi:VOC family protein [Paenibacillus piri]|uniref:VOC family protein n=1 Tax=Paenibacillus piri TaxID=2547395 RepID=A0A4R5KJ35_9BACL|nr:VOC family protein [Paenibacillus piri]TDF94798.1 VOC family protein [Paenibacillus piri]